MQNAGVVWGGFFATMGLPVSAVTFNPQDQPIEFFASAGLGSLCVVTVVVLRLYLVSAQMTTPSTAFHLLM